MSAPHPLEMVKTLSANLALLEPSQRPFAKSLCDQANKKAHLSEKQMFWVAKFASKIELLQSGVPDFTKPDPVQVQSFAAVIAFFAKAATKLKYPKITLQLDDNSPLQLSLAGPSSKHPATVNLTDGGPFGVNKWYGRVSTDGTWNPSDSAEAHVEEIASLLVLLADNPARLAADHGHLTGNCCFCHTKLTDEKSTSAGYGPVCAKNWGLVWGQAEKKETADA